MGKEDILEKGGLDEDFGYRITREEELRGDSMEGCRVKTGL